MYHTKKLYSIPKMDNYDQFQILTRNPIYNFNWFLWIFPIKDMTTQLTPQTLNDARIHYPGYDVSHRIGNKYLEF